LGVIGFYFYLIQPAEPVKDLVVTGNTAYLPLGRAGLAIVDITDPRSPDELAVFDTLGDASAVAVEGQFAYLADGREGVRVLDVSNPLAPAEAAVFDTPGFAADVAVAGDFAYVADNPSGLFVFSLADEDIQGRQAAVSRLPLEGGARRVAVQGQFAYVGDGARRLRVIRISDPRQPEEVLALDIQSSIEDMAFAGNRLYLAAGERGLVILDVTDPDQPAELAVIAQPGPVRDVAVVGNVFAYLAEGEAGLRVLNVSQPETPREVGSYGRPLDARQVVVADGRVYLADRDIGLYLLTAEVSARMGTILSDESQRGNAQDVAVDGRFAYVASAGQGLRVIDIRDPAETEEAAFFDTGGDAIGVTLAGDFIYLADGAAGWWLLSLDERQPERILVEPIVNLDTPGETHAVAVQGQTAYVADGSSGLRIYSLANPGAPVEMSAVDTPGIARDVAIFGEYAYIADGEAGLRVINVLDPVRPAEVGFFDTPGESWGVAVALRQIPTGAGGTAIQALAYLADGGGGLRVIDVSDPRRPFELVAYTPYEYVQDLELRGDLVYLAARGAGLRAVSIADLSRLGEIGALDTPGEARGLALAGEFAFVADHNRGLRIVAISEPARLTEVGFFDVPRVVRKVKVAGGRAFLADAERGFRIADVSAPRRMREIGHYDQGGLVEDFEIQGDLVYTAQATGLQAVNVADPRNPVLVGEFRTRGPAATVHVAGNLAYVATRESGLVILDVAQPEFMREISRYDTPGIAQDVFVSENYVFIADGEAGLEIVNVSDPFNPRTAGLIDQFLEVRSVVVVDQYAFLADGPNGIWVIDAALPVAPRTVGYLDTEGSALHLDSTDWYLFVADGERGVHTVFILQPDDPLIVGTAELGGLSLNLDAEARPAAGGEPGATFVYVAKGERGLEILSISEAVITTLSGIYQTPGFAPLSQVARDGFHLIPPRGAEKSTRTVQHILFDIFFVGVLGFVFWLAFFTQFVLPLQRLSDRVKAISRLLLYVIGAHGPAIRIENGKIVQRAGEEKRRGPGVILLDTASAALLRTKTAFKRVVGPGVVFTEPGEYLHPESVDLHVRVHPPQPLGPFPHEDPFAPQIKGRTGGESDDVYQARQRRRMETSALTRDGIEVVARILTIVKIKSEPGQGGTEFGFNRRSVQLALTREGVVPQELRNVPWYEIPAYLAVDVWREVLSKFSLSDLFDTLAALQPREVAAQTDGGASPEDPAAKAGLLGGETGLETVVRMVRERLTQSEVTELDPFGRPTKSTQKSREFRLLEDMGVQVIQVSISDIKLPPAVDAQLVHQWLSTWLQRANEERDTIEKRRGDAVVYGEEQARLEFARQVTSRLHESLVVRDGQLGVDEARRQLETRASLELLLEGTLEWLHGRPELLQLLPGEAEEIASLLAWVRR
jgi:hypothetical protein